MAWSRDSKIWWAGMLASVVGTVAAQSQQAGVPPEYQGYVQIASLIVGIISGKLATSPLPGAQKDDSVKVPRP